MGAFPYAYSANNGVTALDWLKVRCRCSVVHALDTCASKRIVATDLVALSALADRTMVTHQATTIDGVPARVLCMSSVGLLF